MLFEKFLSVLPSDGQFLYFLKVHDIGAPFRRHVLDEMYTFLHHWGNAEHEFKKKCVEESRKKLYDLTAEFSSKLSLNIFPDGSEFYSMGINDWEDRPDRLRVRDELNAMATTLYSCHQDLVRRGKKYFV